MTNLLRYRLALLCGLLFTTNFIALGQTYDFTYGYHYMDTISRGNAKGKVFLWIPPSVAQGMGVVQHPLRGLILSSQTVAEDAFCRSAVVRAAANDARLGIVHINPGIITGFGTGSDVGLDTATLMSALNKLADQSGLEAIRHCPWLTFGHSAGSAFARNVPWWKPGRAIGAIVFKGGAIAQPSFTSNSLSEVPLMALCGQFEEYGPNGGCAPPRDSDANYRGNASQVLALRQNTPRQLGFAAMAPGEGHFHMTRPEMDSLIYHFIVKATNARVPAGAVADNGPITLNQIDETTGWLADTSVYAGAAIDSFPNVTDPESKFWFFDREMAQLWRQTSAAPTLLNLNRTFLGNVNTPNISNVTSLQYNDCNGKSWVGNANYGEVITFNDPGANGRPLFTAITSGAGTNDGANSFTVNPSLAEFGNLWLQMWSDADVANNQSGADRLVRIRQQRRTQGQANNISIAPIPMAAVGATVTPNLTIPSGETPYITVLAGPAYVDNGRFVTFPVPSDPLRTDKIVHYRIATAGNGNYQSSQVLEGTFEVFQAMISTPRALLNQVKVFPNPSVNNWVVELPKDLAVSSITLNNSQGKQVYEITTVDSGQHTIPAQNLATDVYVLHIKTSAGSITKKVVRL